MRRAGAMIRRAAALAAGLTFGLGLLISEMADPARVLGFLDLLAIPSGGWDPTLAFVMAGAVAVSSAAWAVSRRRAEAAFGGPLPPLPRQSVDARLIGGAALFGVGWGLVGVCPGPALAGLALGGASSAVFLAAMLAGMLAFTLMQRRLDMAAEARQLAPARVRP